MRRLQKRDCFKTLYFTAGGPHAGPFPLTNMKAHKPTLLHMHIDRMVIHQALNELGSWEQTK